MINNKTKAIILQIILIAVFTIVFVVGILDELNTNSENLIESFLNGFSAFTCVIPSAAVLVSNINWFFVNKYKSKENFAKWSVILYVFAYIIGIICGFIHYEMPLTIEGFNFYLLLLGPGIILAILFSIVIYILSKVYFRLIKG